MKSHIWQVLRRISGFNTLLKVANFGTPEIVVGESFNVEYILET